MMSRRTFLQASAGLLAASVRHGADAKDFEEATHYPDPTVEVLDPSFEKYRDVVMPVQRLATGFMWAEGPAWSGEFGLLIFCDVVNNRLMQWREATGEVSVFRAPSNFANGAAFDREGRLLVCENATRRLTRIEHDGQVTTIMDHYQGKTLNSPNDVVCKSDGAIWFTDPAFGPGSVEGMGRPDLPGNIYRVSPDTGQVNAVATAIAGPNGLAFSPDEKLLYVVESRAAPHRLISVFDVVDGTRLANRRVFFDCGAGTADGFRVDRDGNLWCGWGMGEREDGVVVLSPQGRMIGRIHLPERCANLCFGGQYGNRLLMTASRSLYSLYVKARGAV